MLYDKNAPLNAAFVFQHAKIFQESELKKWVIKGQRECEGQKVIMHNIVALLKFLSLNIW